VKGALVGGTVCPGDEHWCRRLWWSALSAIILGYHPAGG
jgi:hypothetical protein